MTSMPSSARMSAAYDVASSALDGMLTLEHCVRDLVKASSTQSVRVVVVEAKKTPATWKAIPAKFPSACVCPTVQILVGSDPSGARMGYRHVIYWVTSGSEPLR